MESDYWEAPQVGIEKHLLFLSCTIHKGNTMKLNFATHQKAVKKWSNDGKEEKLHSTFCQKKKLAEILEHSDRVCIVVFDQAPGPSILCRSQITSLFYTGIFNPSICIYFYYLFCDIF